LRDPKTSIPNPSDTTWIDATYLPLVPGSVPSVSYFDTWTSRKDDVFDYTQNAPVPMTGSMVNGTLVPVTDATGQPISRSQLPRIMAIQITLRIWNPGARVARQVTIVQEM
jgi:hypothetical protein